MKKILFICIGLLLCLMTACSQKVEYNENEYIHSLTSIIDTNYTYKYKNALPDQMEGASRWITASVRMHLEERAKIIEAYMPLRKLYFRYIKEISREEEKEFYLSFGVEMHFGKEVVHAAIKYDGTVIFRNIQDDYFISEPNVINLDEYAIIFYSEWNKGK